MQTLRFTVSSYELMRGAFGWPHVKMLKLCKNRITSEPKHPLSHIPEEIWSSFEDQLLSNVLSEEHLSECLARAYVPISLYESLHCDTTGCRVAHDAAKRTAAMEELERAFYLSLNLDEDQRKSMHEDEAVRQFRDSEPYQSLVQSHHAAKAVCMEEDEVRCGELHKAIHFHKVWLDPFSYVKPQYRSIWQAIESFLRDFGLVRMSNDHGRLQRIEP